jgi:hypothetical protein
MKPIIPGLLLAILTIGTGLAASPAPVPVPADCAIDPKQDDPLIAIEIAALHRRIVDLEERVETMERALSAAAEDPQPETRP